MSGEFKMRVWDVENAKMLAWDDIWYSVANIPPEWVGGGVPWVPFLTAICMKAPATKYVVERWTGLTDRSGREIYEGDIVTTSNDGNDGCDEWDADDYGPALVSMDEEGVHICEQGHLKEPGYCWSWDDGDSVHHTTRLTVIGNIHEPHAT